MKAHPKPNLAIYFSIILALLLLAGLLAITRPVQANTYQVTNTNDSGPGSLRQAISDANDNTGADIITFASETDGIPIVLAGAANDNTNASGDLDILNGGDLTIQGNGTANTIIDGGGIDRVIHVCPGGSCEMSITFSGVSIQNGLVAGGGGGIRHEAGTLTLDNVSVINNAAINGGGVSNFATLYVQNGSFIGEAGKGNFAVGGSGGGIYNYAGSTTLDNSAVLFNTASNNGGGIWNQTTLIVQNNSTIGEIGISNQATNGGGIYNYAGSTTLDASSVTSNTATTSGGGIYNQDTLNVQNGSTINANKATTSEDENGGGGIYNIAGTLTIDAASVIFNMAVRDGGGIFNDNGTLNVQNGSAISANQANDDGGGIFNDNGTLNIQGGSTVGTVGQGNWAFDSAGGIYNFGGTTTLNDSSVISNTANSGGGIFSYISGSTTTLINSSILSNTANSGGGIFNDSGHTIVVDSSTVSANRANNNGGGIFNNATLNVQNGSTIGEPGSGNQANDGGGIYNNFGTTTLDASSVISNTVTDDGGGIYNEATLQVQNGSEIYGNYAYMHGGGVMNSSGTVTVDASHIHTNEGRNLGGGISNYDTLFIQNGTIIGAGNLSSQGGGIYNSSSGNMTVGNSTIRGNISYELGGGILNYSVATLTSSTIISNTGRIGGGGIENYGSGMVTMDDTTVVSNISQFGDGGGIRNGSGTVILDNSTVISNTAFTNGGGIYNSDTMTVTASRILKNNAATNGGGIFANIDEAGATNITGSCIVGNSAMAFFNSQPAQQIATGNWWGAATGPNTLGADTVLGNVDVSGYLTAPILDCAPDLQVSKTNDTGGEAHLSIPFHWSLIISNTGFLEANFGSGQTILQDDLPAGPAYDTPTVGDFTHVNNSANISCAITDNTLTCETTDADVSIGAAGSFEVSFAVTPSALVTLVNPAGICRVDPDGNLSEGNENNNDCPANTVNVTLQTINIYLPFVSKVDTSTP